MQVHILLYNINLSRKYEEILLWTNLVLPLLITTNIQYINQGKEWSHWLGNRINEKERMLWIWLSYYLTSRNFSSFNAGCQRKSYIMVGVDCEDVKYFFWMTLLKDAFG